MAIITDTYVRNVKAEEKPREVRVLGMFLLNDDTEDGFLAEHSEAVRKLQAGMDQMKDHLLGIAKNVKKTADSMGDAARSLEHVAGDAKRQVELIVELSESSDARKRLAQHGLRYDSRQFTFKIMDGDLEAQKLFYEAGMQPDSHDSQGGMPIFAAILGNAPNWRESLLLAIREGGFDANKIHQIFIGPTLDPGKNEEQLTEWLEGDSELFAFFQPDLMDGRENLDVGSLVALTEIIPSPATLDLVKTTGLDLKKGVELREKLAKQYEDYANELADSLNRLWLCEKAYGEISNPQARRDEVYIIGQPFRTQERYDPSHEAFAKSIKEAVAAPLDIGISSKGTPAFCPAEYLIDGFLEFRMGLFPYNNGYYVNDPTALLNNIRSFREKTGNLDFAGFRKRLSEYRAGTSELLKASGQASQDNKTNGK